MAKFHIFDNRLEYDDVFVGSPFNRGKDMSSPKCIRLAVFDFDGVFSDGAIYFGDQTRARKVYNGRDSFGIRKLLDIGIDVGIITNDVSVSLDNAVHIRDRIKFISARADQDK